MRTLLFLLFTGLLLFLAGCGSVSNNMQPSPPRLQLQCHVAESGPSPSPTPAAASDAFLASWFFTVGRNSAPVGTITLDTTANNGAGN